MMTTTYQHCASLLTHSGFQEFQPKNFIPETLLKTKFFKLKTSWSKKEPRENTESCQERGNGEQAALKEVMKYKTMIRKCTLELDCS